MCYFSLAVVKYTMGFVEMRERRSGGERGKEIGK